MTSVFVRQPRTDADVQLLLVRFREVQPDGRVIQHMMVEATLGVARDTPRYKTVVHHWRRALFRERRIFLDGRAAKGTGFKALTPDEMVRYGSREVQAAGRKLRKAILVIATPHDSELSADDTRLYRARSLAAAEQIVQTHGRLLKELQTPLRPPPQLPRAR